MKNISETPQLPKTADMQNELLSAVSCGIFAYTIPEKRVIECNSRARKIMGITGDNDLDVSVFSDFVENRVSPENREDLRCAADSLKQNGDTRTLTIKATSGLDTIYISVNIRRMHLDSAGTDCLLFTFQNVTQQTRHISSIEQDRHNYFVALTKGCEFNFTFDLTDGKLYKKFTTANNLDIFAILGLSVPVTYDELAAKYMTAFKLQLLDPDMIRFFTREGLMESYENDNTHVIVEYFSPKTNRFIRVYITLYHECITDHVYAFVVAADTSSVRRREREQTDALEDALDKVNTANNEMSITIDAILDGISGGLRILAENGELEHISEGAANLIGYTAEEFMQRFRKNYLGYIHRDDRKICSAETSVQLKESGCYTVKYRVVTREGGIKWVLDRGKAVSRSDGKNFYYSVLQDITDLEERNQRLNDVLTMQEIMADSLGTGIFAYTMPEKKVLILNQAVRDMFGYKGSNPMQFGHKIMDLVSDNDRPIVAKAVKSLKKVGDKTEYIFHSKRVDGTELTVSNRTKLLSFPNGQKFILSSMVDITQREREEMNIDEERSRSLAGIISDSEVFFNVDLSDGLCSNPIVSETGGKMMQKLGLKLPMKYNEFAMASFIKTNPVKIIGDVKDIISCEKLMEKYHEGISRIDIEVFIPETGSYYRITVLMSELVHSTSVNASIILYDITDDKMGKKHSRSIIQTIGNIYTGVYFLSINENRCLPMKQYTDAKDVFERNCTCTKFIKTYSEQFVEPEFTKQIQEFLSPENIRKKLSKENSVANIEYQRKGMGWCRAIISAIEFDRNGTVSAVIFAGYSIDKQRKAQIEALEAIKNAKHNQTDFLTNLSHDLRTPLNSIVGLTAIAETHIDDRERVEDCLAKINISSKHLIGLIGEIVDMSQVESGDFKLKDDFFNIPELMDNLIADMNSEFLDKDQLLTFNARNIEHENVIGDSQRLHQIFLILMHTAAYYTPEGGNIRLSVSELPAKDSETGVYRFVFEDSSVGVSEDLLSRIFVPFARDKTSGEVYGTGLGLPITKNIVDIMGGDVTVESTENVGTKVTVTIPLKIETGSLSAYDGRFKSLHVLVADSDENSCGAACELLSDLGIECEWVTDSSTAVQRTIERHSVGDDYFAVILDRKLNGVGGLKAAKEIRRSLGKQKPVIIISAFDRSDVEQEYSKAGANGIITKPIFRSRIIHLLSQFVTARKQQDRHTGDLSAIKAEDFSSKRALLVEDNELNAEIAGEILSLAGLKVEYATNGKDALDMISAASDDYYNIVFMDIQMPLMNGYAAARAIRALPGSYPRRVPIIAMTANTFTEDIEAALNAGMNEHIAKPIDFDRLLLVLKKWLDA